MSDQVSSSDQESCISYLHDEHISSLGGYEADDEDSTLGGDVADEDEVTSAFNPAQAQDGDEEVADNGAQVAPAVPGEEDAASTNEDLPIGGNNLKRKRVCVEDDVEKRGRLDD